MCIKYAFTLVCNAPNPVITPEKRTAIDARLYRLYGECARFYNFRGEPKLDITTINKSQGAALQSIMETFFKAGLGLVVSKIEPHLKMSLDECCEYWSVDDPDAWENEIGPKGWWAVSTADAGIIAYFYDSESAYRFRLSEINRYLNE